jgi:hypothetical protein
MIPILAPRLHQVSGRTSLRFCPRPEEIRITVSAFTGALFPVDLPPENCIKCSLYEPLATTRESWLPNSRMP